MDFDVVKDSENYFLNFGHLAVIISHFTYYFFLFFVFCRVLALFYYVYPWVYCYSALFFITRFAVTPSTDLRFKFFFLEEEYDNVRQVFGRHHFITCKHEALPGNILFSPLTSTAPHGNLRFFEGTNLKTVIIGPCWDLSKASAKSQYMVTPLRSIPENWLVFKPADPLAIMMYGASNSPYYARVQATLDERIVRDDVFNVQNYLELVEAAAKTLD